MGAQWFYAQAGQQQGPVSFEELQRLAASGGVGRDDLVWSEGMSNWQPAHTVANLLPAAPSPAPTPTPVPTPAAAPMQPAMHVPPPGQYPQSPMPPGAHPGMPMGYAGPPAGQPPPNYLVWAILCTLLCCMPAGIVSIVYAAQVNSKWQRGDVYGAQESSRKAKTWAWVSFGIGLVVTLLAVVANIVGEASRR